MFLISSANFDAMLIALAIEAQLDGGKSKSINRQTCDAVLRLLGLGPSKAAKAVDAFLC